MVKIKNSSIFPAIALTLTALSFGVFWGRNSRLPVITTQNTPPETLWTLPTDSQTRPEPCYPIDINTADSWDLSFLPGIGEALAQRIVSYRESNGPFSSPEELTQVDGIGETKLKQLLPYITIGG